MPSTVSVAEDTSLSGAGRTTWASASSEVRTAADGAAPASYATEPSAPSTPAHPPTRVANCRSTAGTGSGRAAADARPCWASVTRRSSRWRACAISPHTARATAVNGVRGGTSTSGRPRRSHASASAAGTVSYTGVTPKPSAAPPASTIRAT